jgi:hypothetical protein
VAIKNGFITKEQLHEVIKIQIVEELEGANRRLTGQILLEKGYMTNAQVDEVLISMGLL